ncbi:BEL1-like homeodomain protein 11 isoform X1 [Magnolia sinica]|uniref:BEL1-like homeodomain protein 11 isoform X1 n=1 Tax=Magnolia sinica TaxID=86752 RepID=UPI002659D95F|nr:BEL1-like homeodomain protein 11 isoform X1 [Magnolia sinica]XP_058086331.1 BEL1-like homeodomain protein 11 isoform X1 [Magnolia sinica]
MVGNPASFEDRGYVSQWDGKSSNATAFVQFNGVLLPSIQTLGERMCRTVDLVHEDDEMCRRRHLIECDRQDYSSSHGQGLSLSLSSYPPPVMPISSFSYTQTDLHTNQAGCSRSISREEAGDMRFASSAVSQSHSGSTSDELVSFSAVLRNSRYLRPAQKLLEEVVSVSRDVEFDSDKQLRQDTRITRSGMGALGAAAEAGKNAMNRQKTDVVWSHGECSPIDMHDIQIRITKLVALLDEVDSRYEQYCRRMGEVVSSFELVAGLGAAKSYTALTLQAMSRHFRSLRGAIITQIRAARRCLSKELPRIHGGLSKLSLLDQNARQKGGALQQMGMIQIQQAWRPLRGLPENAVVVLRAWLFEHFLHPYPNDSEKLMLASQTGLSRNQAIS